MTMPDEIRQTIKNALRVYRRAAVLEDELRKDKKPIYTSRVDAALEWLHQQEQPKQGGE